MDNKGPRLCNITKWKRNPLRMVQKRQSNRHQPIMVHGNTKQVIPMTLTNKEKKVLKETRLRNLKRKYAKVIQDPSLTEEAIELKAEIDNLQRILNSQ